MPTLSSAGWFAHDVGLATSIGGTVFGKYAFAPAVEALSDERAREVVSERAWHRFSWVNIAAHVAFAVPWLIGRTMLSGAEAGPRARSLTSVKDVLVGVSLLTGIASAVVGRILGNRTRDLRGRQEDRRAKARLARVVAALGTANLVSTLGIGAVTTLLAMEGNTSARFTLRSRTLP